MNKKLKNYIFCVFLLIALLIGCFSISAAPKGYDLILGTATMGGTWYPVGIGMGNLWTEKLKDEGIRVSGQSSAGSPENVQMLRLGEVEIAMLIGHLANKAYNGIDIYEGKPLKKLRGMAAFSINYLHYLITKDKVKSGNVKDVDGLHYSPGPTGGGGEQTFRIVSEALNLKIRKESLGYTPSSDAIRNGQLDGASYDAAPPVSAVISLYAAPATKVQVLSFTQEDVNKLNDIVPGAFWLDKIKAGTYMNQDKDIPVACYTNILAVSVDVPDEVVYKLLKTLYDNLDYMVDVHPSCKSMSIDNAITGMPIPLHPGAVKFYKEMGLDIPEKIL